MEQASQGERPLAELDEGEKIQRVMRCVRGPNWDFLSSLASLPDNVIIANDRQAEQ